MKHAFSESGGILKFCWLTSLFSLFLVPIITSICLFNVVFFKYVVYCHEVFFGDEAHFNLSGFVRGESPMPNIVFHF